MINWIKNNRLVTLLLLIVSFFVFNNFIRFQELGYSPVSMMNTKSFGTTSSYYSDDYAMMDSVEEGFGMMAGESGRAIMPPIQPDFEPVAQGANRVVIQDSSLSLLVSDVREVGNQIVSLAENAGGFMVNSSYNRPEESAFATITVRVPTTRLTETLETYRNLAVKVTNENLQGRDVTEQYTDIEARLETLETTKAKFEEILAQATEIQDILQVNQQLIYIQDQIDSLIGRREAIEDNASLTKITVFLSTDELSLPYSPDDKFRPGVIFKLAVRGLLTSLVGIAELAIWVAVYSIIWVPVLALIFLARRYYLKNQKR